MADPTCSIDGCDRTARARGWCRSHYRRWLSYGDPLGVSPRARGVFVERSTVEDRFWSKVCVPENPLDCWTWTGASDPVSGYGRIQVQRKLAYAHRVSYELSMGTIGAGLEIDHLCRVRLCVNPLHLQAVPKSVNTRRQPRYSVTHCPQGHPYSGGNLYERDGRRHCRTCMHERAKAFRDARRAS